MKRRTNSERASLVGNCLRAVLHALDCIPGVKVYTARQDCPKSGRGSLMRDVILGVVEFLCLVGAGLCFVYAAIRPGRKHGTHCRPGCSCGFSGSTER